MYEDNDANRQIDDFLAKSEANSSSGDAAIKIGIAVFIAIVSAFFVREAYQQYQLQQFAKSLERSSQKFNQKMERMHARSQDRLRASRLESQRQLRERNARNRIKTKERERKIYLDNYWKDIGSGTFINVGRSKKNGDLATAIIKVNNRQFSININCNNETYWSIQNNGWFAAANHYSTEYKMINTACSNDK